MKRFLILWVYFLILGIGLSSHLAWAGTYYSLKSDSLKKALNSTKASEDKYYRLANRLIYLYNGARDREGIFLSRRILSEAKANKNIEGEIIGIWGKARSLFIALSTDSAQIFAEELIDKASLEKNEYWLSEGYLCKAWVLHRLTLNSDALTYVKKAITIKQKLGDNRGLSRAFVIYAVAFGMRGNWLETVNYNLKALQYAIKDSDPVMPAGIYGNLSELYNNVDSLDKAESLVRKAYRIYDSLGFQNNIPACLLKLAIIAKKKKQIPEAISLIEQGITLATMGMVVYDMAQLHMSYSQLLVDIGDLKKAEEVNDYGLELSTKTQDLNMVFRLMRQKIEIYIAQKKYKEATDLFGKLDTIKTNMDFQNNERLVYANSRALETELKNKEIAVKEAEITSQKRINGIAFGVISVTSVLTIIIFIQFRRQLQTRKALEEAQADLESRNNELTNVNQTKDKLLSIVGHDLRGPIGSYARVPEVYKMMVAKGNTEAIQELMDELERSAYQTLRLLDNLMKWAISQSGQFELKPQNLTLRQILEDASAQYSETLNNKKISLEITPAQGLSVYGDKDSLETAFRNLISNAIKFTFPGGRVVIEARKEADTIHVILQDFGMGMSEEQLQKLFSPDKKKERKGTVGEGSSGLGLLLVQEMIRINQGVISVKSSEGMGTVVVVILPAGKPELPQA